MSHVADAFDDTKQHSLPISFDTAMAYCRLASEQATVDGSSKPAKEARCLSRLLAAAGATLVTSDRINLIDLGAGNGERRHRSFAPSTASVFGLCAIFPSILARAVAFMPF
jgi:hypothetical protein